MTDFQCQNATYYNLHTTVSLAEVCCDRKVHRCFANAAWKSNFSLNDSFSSVIIIESPY